MHPAGSRVPALTLLSHPDVRRVGERAVLWDAQRENGEALLSRWQLEFSPPGGGGGRPLEDPYVSRRPIRLSSARFGGIRVDCTRTGTRVIANDDWISEDRVFLGVEVERGVVLVLAERLALLLHHFDESADGGDLPGFGLVGESAPMLRLRREIRGVAAEQRAVLLRGAAGSGKKTVARAIHHAGGADRPFVTIRDATAATVPDLLAKARGGTLLLDALEELATELQAELLTSLDGGAGDVRILATVNDHRCASSSGPLLVRLDAQAIEVPALGKRRDDVGRLVYHFLDAALGELAAGNRLADPGPFSPPWLPVRLVAFLAGYDWPRNVGQLHRVARQLACDHHDKPHVDVGPDLEELLEGRAAVAAVGWGWSAPERRKTRRSRLFGSISETELLSALRTHRWQAEPTAAHLGVSPEALFAMIEKYSERSQRRKGPRRSRPAF